MNTTLMLAVLCCGQGYREETDAERWQLNQQVLQERERIEAWRDGRPPRDLSAQMQPPPPQIVTVYPWDSWSGKSVAIVALSAVVLVLLWRLRRAKNEWA